MNREMILQEAKAELERHVWDTFVEGKASVALGGTGVVVSGCEACRKRFGTNSQYLRHLADDVLPEILEHALKPNEAGQAAPFAFAFSVVSTDATTARLSDLKTKYAPGLFDANRSMA